MKRQITIAGGIAVAAVLTLASCNPQENTPATLFSAVSDQHLKVGPENAVHEIL